MENIKNVRIYEMVIALFLSSILFINWALDGVLRTSISDYAYSTKYPYLLVCQLTIGSTMLINNWLLNSKHWYNLVLGISLFMVGITPHLDYPKTHYTFAIIFLAGSILAIWLSSNTHFRVFKTFISFIATIGVVIGVVFKPYSIAITEVFAIIPFCSFFIIKNNTEAIKKTFQSIKQHLFF